MIRSALYGYYEYKRMKRRLNWPQSKLQAVQIKKCNAVLAKFSGMEGNGKIVIPRLGKMNSLAEITMFPQVTKNRLYDIIGSDQKVRGTEGDVILRTSGSTTDSATIAFTKSEYACKVASFYRMLRFNGYTWSDRLLSFMDPQYVALKGKNRYACFPFGYEVVTDYRNDPNEHIRYLLLYKPTVLRGRMSAIYNLACALEKKDVSIRQKIVFTSGEQLLSHHRECIQHVFQCPVIDYYSTTECGVIAWECLHHRGYHVDSDNILLETIYDKVSKKYKIIVTNLNSFLTPIFRFQIDDYTSGFVNEMCPCGCTFPLLKDIQGHKNA